MNTGITGFKPFYFQGETAQVAVVAPEARQVSVIYGSASLDLTKEGDAFKGKIETNGLIGETHYTIFETLEDGSVQALAHGTFVVRCAGRSKMRDVLAAVDEAIKTYATNPNRTINVGELSISYKDLTELLSIRSFYLQQVEAEENGRVLTGGLKMIRVEFKNG